MTVKETFLKVRMKRKLFSCRIISIIRKDQSLEVAKYCRPTVIYAPENHSEVRSGKE